MFQSPFGDGRVSQNFDLAPKDLLGGLFANPANVKKVGLVMGASIPPATWISHWRSLTFSAAGAEFPHGGFNEKGLFVALLVLPSTEFPPIADPRPAVSGTQFVQYNLDQSATIDEVITSDKKIRPFSSLFKTHYFVCESSGACAVLQYIGGKLVVYRGHDLPYSVLTNSLYPESAVAAQSCSKEPCDTSNNSLWRFSELTYLKTKMSNDKTYPAQAFSILDQVAQATGPVTRFQVMYDPKNHQIQVRKKGATSLAFLNVDFSSVTCDQPRKIIPINGATHGDLSNSWQNLTEEVQTRYARHMDFPETVAMIYGHHPFRFPGCQNSSGSK